VKILAFSDLHCSEPACRSLVERSEGFDLVIGAGDFASMHHGLEPTLEILAGIEVPALLVPGNNETEDALREAAESWPTATVLHGESTEVGGITFFGLGAGIPTTPWEWSFDLDDAEADEMLAGCPEGAVMIVHSPPLGHCDESSGGEHLGSPAIAAAIELRRPPLAVCGHIHESWGARSQIGPTEVANLGPEGATFEL
jgi:Icc-related predicted phosphoesterase